MPQASIDPVVMAASTVLRLQTIVSREVAPADAAVLTIGALQAGTKENVIPDDAVIKLNVRTFDETVRQRVLGAIERIVNAESQASGAPKPPEIRALDRYDLVRNDEQATERVRDALRAQFGDERVIHTGPASASEDFGSFGVQWHAPSVSGLSAGSIPRPTRGQNATAGSANCPPTITRSSPWSSTPRCRPAWRRLSPRRAPG
jgi:hippurate hydrolase